MLAPRDRDKAIMLELIRERVWQDAKFGENRELPEHEWWLIVTEEFGEAAHEITDFYFSADTPKRIGNLAQLRHELIQTAASCVAMIDGIDRRWQHQPMYGEALDHHEIIEKAKRRAFMEARNGTVATDG